MLVTDVREIVDYTLNMLTTKNQTYHTSLFWGLSKQNNKKIPRNEVIYVNIYVQYLLYIDSYAHQGKPVIYCYLYHCKSLHTAI